MTGAERGFLLLSGSLGDPQRNPLSVSQLRILGSRAQTMAAPGADRDLTIPDLMAIGYGEDMAARILALLEQEDVLDFYLRKGEKAGCIPLTRVSSGYPGQLRNKLGLESPGCLWAKGNPEFLKMPMISLVGSREILSGNRAFAWEVGAQAARQGFVLVSGNARGADRIAQSACLQNGGSVISVVADALKDKTPDDRILYLSEEDFDAEFSAQRALSRNRVIHALGEKTFVAQSDLRKGGSWDGTVKNLRFGWSDVFCFDDGSAAAEELFQMGAERISAKDLRDIRSLQPETMNFFDQ